MCDVMVEAETDLMQLLARFPGVDFEKKEVEIGNDVTDDCSSFLVLTCECLYRSICIN